MKHKPNAVEIHSPRRVEVHYFYSPGCPRTWADPGEPDFVEIAKVIDCETGEDIINKLSDQELDEIAERVLEIVEKER